jgi:hypothetical protein
LLSGSATEVQVKESGLRVVCLPRLTRGAYASGWSADASGWREQLNFTIAHQTPWTTRYGVFVPLADKFDGVCILEILYAAGVAVELLVIALDGAGVLFAAMNHFDLAVALDLLRQSGSSRSQGDHHQGQHDQEDNQ